MGVTFITDRLGYPSARATGPWVAAASALEDDLQGDVSFNYFLAGLRASLRDGSRVELSGNAHTIVAVGGTAEVVCDHSPQVGSTRLPTSDLIDLILAWQSFRARGTPKRWPEGTGSSAGTVQPPQV